MPTLPKTLILTGASRGIGHATVKRFSDEDWRIITCSRDEVPDACQRDPNWHGHIPVELENSQDVARFIEEANRLLGDDPLHALVNNAAVSPKTEFKERLGCLNGDLNTWRRVFELNFVINSITVHQIKKQNIKKRRLIRRLTWRLVMLR